MTDLPYNITIKPLSEYIEEDPTMNVYVESSSNEDRKNLTKIKNDLIKEDIIKEYEYIAKTKDKPAKAKFVIEQSDVGKLCDSLPEHLQKKVSVDGIKNAIAY